MSEVGAPPQVEAQRCVFGLSSLRFFKVDGNSFIPSRHSMWLLLLLLLLLVLNLLLPLL